MINELQRKETTKLKGGFFFFWEWPGCLLVYLRKTQGKSAVVVEVWNKFSQMSFFVLCCLMIQYAVYMSLLSLYLILPLSHMMLIVQTLCHLLIHGLALPVFKQVPAKTWQLHTWKIYQLLVALMLLATNWNFLYVRGDFTIHWTIWCSQTRYKVAIVCFQGWWSAQW